MGTRGGLAVLGFAAMALAAAPAQADKHIFIIASNADGYGVDRCLATGASCGKPVATAYCHAQDYEQAVSFRKVERAEVTAAVATAPNACDGSACDDLIAIECTR
jgi:hypothetical protein